MNSNVAGTSIEIDNTVLEGIRSHVAGQYPAEACGVLLKQIGGSEVTTVRIRQFCMAENCSQGSDSLDSYRINPLYAPRVWKKTMSDGSAVEMRVAAVKQNNIGSVVIMY